MNKKMERKKLQRVSFNVTLPLLSSRKKASRMDNETVISDTIPVLTLNNEVSALSLIYQNRRTSMNSELNSVDYHSVHRKSSSILTNEISVAMQKKVSESSRRASIKQSNSRYKLLSKNLARKLTEDQRAALRRKFIKSVELCLICIKWCKWAYKYNKEIRDKYLSFSQMYDFEEASNDKSKENLTGNETNSNSEFVSFNKEYFKSKRKLNDFYHMSNETRQILMKKPNERNKADVEALRTSFKHIKSISSLPVAMQNKVYKKCWLENYEPKRVIIRQNHRAESFYFILSGSLVVTNRPENSKISYTVCFLETGMSFGELALISKSVRTSTVLSRTQVELLVIAKEDFYRIFSNGNLESTKTTPEKTQSEIILRSQSNKEKPSVSDNDNLSNIEFLRKLKFLEGWSFDAIVQNPQSIMFCYFPRGQVLVRNGNYSKYIYIVKKGSISVWIKIRKRKEENIDTAAAIRKYLLKKQNSDNDENKYEKSEFLSPSNHSLGGSKDDADVALNSKLGAANSYFESDNFLKEQHKEALESTGFRSISENSAETRKTTSNDIARNRLNYLMEYIQMTKVSNENPIEVKVSKGSKLLPGALDKRDKLKILDVNNDKENNDDRDKLIKSRLTEENEDEAQDEKTFTKGRLHLPNIRVEKINKRAELRKSFDINRASHGDIGLSNLDRRTSTYVFKLPSIGNPIKNKKNSFEIPKKKFKTTIELMESNEANSRRESMLPNYFNEPNWKNKHLNTSVPVLKSLRDPFVTNHLMSFDKDVLKNNNEEDEFETEYIEVQVLDSGSHFGLAEILFESQPNMSLISNGCDCILLPKDLFIQNATTTYIRNLRRDEIPFPTMNEIMKSYNEFSSWKKYTSQLLSDAAVNTRRHKRNEELKLSKSFNTSRDYRAMFKSSLI